MNRQRKHIILLLTLLFCLGFGKAYAYEIKVVADGPGTVSGGGEYNSRATCTLKAKAEPDHVFMGWEKDGEIVSEYSTYEFVVTGDGTYKARFRATWGGNLATGTYTLTSSGSGFIVNGNTGTVYDALGGISITEGRTVTIKLSNSNIITFSGEIVVKSGHLTIEKTGVYSGSTLKRHPDYKTRLFQVRNITTNNPEDCKLTLKGYKNGDNISNIVINGGDDGYGIEGPDASGNYTPNYAHDPSQANKTKATRCLLLATGGTINIDGVEFTRNWNDEDGSHGGAIFVTTATGEGDNNSHCRNIVSIKNSYIQNCATASASSGAAIMIGCHEYVGENHIGISEISMENVEIRYCFAQGEGEGRGGVIMTSGNGKCTLSMKNCNIHDNYTNNRGSLTWISESVDALQLDNCTFCNNWTKNSGAALDIEANSVINGGTFYNNRAKNNGGAIYIGASGTLNINGTSRIYNNQVLNAGGHGGGIYHGGTLNVGTSSATSLQVTGNTSVAAKAEVSDNIYLPDTKTIDIGSSITTTGINIGVYTQSIATAASPIPVLTVDVGNETVLANVYAALQNGSSTLTDDRLTHKKKYTSGETTLYFAWPYDHDAYTKAFVGPISNADSLYKYMCWVNGINGFGKHESAAGNLTADIDMSGVDFWIPIGEKETSSSATDPFSGTFNGNGHTISGLTNSNLDDFTNYGLFGRTTTGASISDVFLTCNFSKNEAGTLGALVGLMQGGTVKNCIGSGTLTATHADCITGGLVGQMTGGTIHSSAAMADMTGYQMGGLAGDIASGLTLYNSFANASFTPQSGSTDYIGGLVGVNNGTVENCYSRVRGTVPAATYFGWLVGDNTSGTLNHSYIPASASTNYTATSKTGTQNNLDTYTPVVATYLYNHSNDNLVGSTSNNLCKVLNNWVTTHSGNGYASWKRTMAGGTAYSATAGNINGDYPIHKYSGYTCAASTDGINLDYAASLDAMLTRHASNAIVNLYANEANVTGSTGTDVVVYIDENVSLLQDVSGSKSRTSAIEAYTCQTLKTGSGSRWHFISSSLSNSGIGFTYGQNADFNWEPNPCHVTISTNDDTSLFPSDLPKVDGYSDMTRIDLYAFYEPEYHWINFKRNTNSHFHMNGHSPLAYNGNGTGGNGNETYLVPGKGYLVNVDQEQLLQNKGTLNNGNVVLQDVTYTVRNAWAGLLGYNLLGNPYQSYLDFDEFISYSGNSGLNATKGGGEATYATYDPEVGGYVQYKRGSSRGSRSLSGLIPPHQGFLIRRTGGSERVTATFTNDMRSNDGTATFRGEQPAYPLINLMVTDDKGDSDVAVLELGRDNDEGVEKLRANTCKGWLFLHHNDDDYAILFRTAVEDYQPLWFEADEAGTYTLRWETANGEFGELTLVDNITGIKTDMLERDSYVFEANPDQYASRFKIVIGDYKDIDENNEDGLTTGSGTFAFRMGEEIVVNGEGRLEVIDMLGRIVGTEQLQGSQSMVRKPETAGVYVLRLMGRDEVRTQKIVIR